MVYSRIPSVERNHIRRLSTLFTVFYELFIDVIHATYYPEDGSSSQLDSGSFAQAGLVGKNLPGRIHAISCQKRIKQYMEYI